MGSKSYLFVCQRLFFPERDILTRGEALGWRKIKKKPYRKAKIAFSRNEVTRSRITEVEGKIRALSASWIIPIYTSPGKKVAARISEVSTLSTSTSRSK